MSARDSSPLVIVWLDRFPQNGILFVTGDRSSSHTKQRTSSCLGAVHSYFTTVVCRGANVDMLLCCCVLLYSVHACVAKFEGYISIASSWQPKLPFIYYEEGHSLFCALFHSTNVPAHFYTPSSLSCPLFSLSHALSASRLFFGKILPQEE